MSELTGGLRELRRKLRILDCLAATGMTSGEKLEPDRPMFRQIAQVTIPLHGFAAGIASQAAIRRLTRQSSFPINGISLYASFVPGHDGVPVGCVAANTEGILCV